MGTVTRVHRFESGQLLTAEMLNTEFDLIVQSLNNVIEEMVKEEVDKALHSVTGGVPFERE